MTSPGAEPGAIYRQVLDTLFDRVLRQRMTPALKAELARAGLDLDAPLPPQYGTAKWKPAIESIASHLFPGQGAPRAQLQLGRLLVDEYRQTGWGLATVTLARMLGPRQLLLRAHALMSAPGKVEFTRLQELEEDDFELWLKHIAVSASFTEGLLVSGLEASGASGVTVKHLGGSAQDGHRFSLSWS
ncbi:MAG: DUF2378 family protein [Myxococcota bacterium]|nr:DUF2378 family protein [Myxococcota bacterium]